MSNVDLVRWQFAFTSVNHFLFVPVTIGLAFLTALLQTAWYRSRREEYLRLTRFFGTLLVINVAIGVVTGLRPPLASPDGGASPAERGN
jgi:cytochrome d ubiquinol oxidase subunit I